MTTLPYDDVAPSAVEDAVARLETATPATSPDPASPRHRHLAAVDADAAAAGVMPRRVAERAPRLRLVPALPLAPLAPAPARTAPLVLRERVLALAPGAGVHSEEVDEDRGAAPSTDAGRFAHGVGLACVEVVLGRRPAAQLARWVTPQVLDSLQERAAMVRRAGVLAHARRPAARRVRVCPVDPHAAEACLVVDDGVRVRAVALRLEAHRGAWRVATLQIG